MWRIIIFSTILLSLQYFIYYQFLKYLKSNKWYKPEFRYYALVLFLLFNLPFVIISLITEGNFDPPHWFKQSFMLCFWIWQGATFLILQWLLIGKLLKLPFQIPIWIMKIFKPLRDKIKSVKNKPTVRKVDLSRRRFVRYATFGVTAYAFGAASYGVLRHDKYEITYKNIVIENLPQQLKGLTMTLVSDLHAGQFMDLYDMMEYADVINSLGSDVIFIPGDFVNYQREDSKYVAKAFSGLKAKYGIFGSLGNHDFFMDADYVADVLNNESPVKILRNRHDKIVINGTPLYIIGVDDTKSSGVQQNNVLVDWVDSANNYLTSHFDDYQTSTKILLCHKPYAFDEIAARNIDLTLSGHTHGGQVVPVKAGRFNMSFAALVSKYIEGHYKIGKANMYVSRGLGTVALPIRINCPPEITKITLK